MPIDMALFRSYSPEKQRSDEQDLKIKLIKKKDLLIAIEDKIQEAMTDDSKPSVLSSLLDHRIEIKNDLNQINSDLAQIKRFNENEASNNPDPVSVAFSTSGAGVVNIRADDRKLVKVPGTRTFQEILDKKKQEEQAEKDAGEIAKLDKYLKLLDDYKKVEAKKRTETSKH